MMELKSTLSVHFYQKKAINLNNNEKLACILLYSSSAIAQHRVKFSESAFHTEQERMQDQTAFALF